MKIMVVRTASDDLFTKTTVSPRNRKLEGKTDFTCPKCGKQKSFNWKAFSKANEALNANSPFPEKLRKLFDLTFPLQMIESNVLGRRMKIYLEYSLDFCCSRCRSPYRILFAVVETQLGEPCYMIKWVLKTEERDQELSQESIPGPVTPSA